MRRNLLVLVLGVGVVHGSLFVHAAHAQGIGDAGSGSEVEKTPEDDAKTKPAAPPRRDPNLPLAKQVELAIADGVEWLKKAQREDGSWGPVVQVFRERTPRRRDVATTERPTTERPSDETGPTAFALYTLATCGVKKSDPVFKKGLKWLKAETMVTFDVTGDVNVDDLGRPTNRTLRRLTTYEHAVIVMLIEAMNRPDANARGKRSNRRLHTENPLRRPRGSKIPKDEWKWMHDRVLALTTGRRIRSGKSTSTILGHQHRTGGWRYWQANNPGEDLSSTQFALLALRAASQAGYPVSKVAPKTWSLAAEYVRRLQTYPGGFRYGDTGGPDATASMTACGIVSLVICKEQLELDGSTPPDWIAPVLEKAQVAFVRMYRPVQNSSDGTEAVGNDYFYMYGTERVCDILGLKELGGTDWYGRGASHFIAAQEEDGKWVDATAYNPQDVLGTCFALLFLARATPAVESEPG